MRHADYLRQRYRAVLGYTGLIYLIIGLLILLPVATVAVYPAEAGLAWGFIWPGLALGGGGLWLWRRLAPPEGDSLTWQEGAVIVVLSWLAAVLAGAIPFMALSGLNFTQAVFESTSGWTTTGLSVIDVGRAPHVVLFYRSLTQLAGGAGLAIIMLSALVGPAGPGLSAAEGRSEQLVPHVRQSAKLVLAIYAGYLVVGVAGLRLAGMTWFDAVNHAFAALSTGGFSTRPESIGYWDSPLVEGVIIFLMLLGSLNFLTSYTLLRGKWRAVVRNGEVRLQGFLILLGALVLLLGVTLAHYPSLAKSVRVAIFETVTASSTAGFSTVGYLGWSELGWLVLIVLMLIGGGAGSTAGGLKQYRLYVLYRGLRWEVRRMFLPRTVITEPDVWQGEQRQFLNDTHFRQIGLFVFVELAVFLLGSAVIAAHGYSLRESFFEFASAVGTVGLSVGVTAADAPPGLLWTEIAGMLLGRLEVFTIVVGLLKLAADARAILWPGR